MNHPNPATAIEREIQLRNKVALTREDRMIMKAYTWVLSDNRGRVVLKDMLEKCLHDEDASNPTSSKVYENLGKQKVARAIKKILKKASYEHYIILLREIDNTVELQTSELKGD